MVDHFLIERSLCVDRQNGVRFLGLDPTGHPRGSHPACHRLHALASRSRQEESHRYKYQWPRSVFTAE